MSQNLFQNFSDEKQSEITNILGGKQCGDYYNATSFYSWPSMNGYKEGFYSLVSGWLGYIAKNGLEEMCSVLLTTSEYNPLILFKSG